MSSNKPDYNEFPLCMQADSLEARRAKADLAIARFLDRSKNALERRFWLGKTEQYLCAFEVVPYGELKCGPRVMSISTKECSYLAVAALLWCAEIGNGARVDKQMMQRWYDDFSSESLGDWNNRPAKIVLAQEREMCKGGVGVAPVTIEMPARGL